MAWITPVTDRISGTARMTYTDMNRIYGNISFLYDYFNLSGYTVSGDNLSPHRWNQNDFITVTRWDEVLTVLRNLCSAVGYVSPFPYSRAMTYTNINNVETLILYLRDIADNTEDFARLNHYVGDKLFYNGPMYTGDDINAGGFYK